MTMNEVYDTIISELIENAMHKKMEEDEEFRKCYEKLDELSRKIDSYIQICDSEVKELLLAYEKARNEEEARYGNFLYMQGLKDCYKLLKILEMN